MNARQIPVCEVMTEHRHNTPAEQGSSLALLARLNAADFFGVETVRILQASAVYW